MNDFKQEIGWIARGKQEKVSRETGQLEYNRVVNLCLWCRRQSSSLRSTGAIASGIIVHTDCNPDLHVIPTGGRSQSRSTSTVCLLIPVNWRNKQCSVVSSASTDN